MKKLLRINALQKYYQTNNLFGGKNTIKAVDGVSLEVEEGTTLGIVGESGCGKSSLAKTILGIEELTAGSIYIGDQNLSSIDRSQKCSLIQMIFQDPYNSLNPRKKAWELIGAPLIIQGKLSREEIYQKCIEAMELVGLTKEMAYRYPHMFSGGQRQRIGIARALVTRPKVIICDEPISALDVSIQAQIINLLKKLQKELKITYIFIGHDLSAIQYIAHDVAVMYLGKIVEYSSVDNVFNRPAHPYTRALINSSPVVDPNKTIDDFEVIQGELPSPANPPTGCHFHSRCKEALSHCQGSYPCEFNLGDHYVKCHLYSS
jgi:dipeptide transport system ATP-binding protein